ncbi:MAG: hypothetical protein HFH68_04960 [Lachnospiraceae bacterium]|nr:hypothetical protein [Lachnospiraceae bacterium]
MNSNLFLQERSGIMEFEIIPVHDDIPAFDKKEIKIKYVEYYPYGGCYVEDEITEELSPLISGGQSPVEKFLAINDIEAGIKATEYFIRTGKIYPGIVWAKQL